MFNILIAEDNPVNQEVIKSMLEVLFQCRVDVAATGGEALEAWSRNFYDAILMDCQMPDMDGYEATGRIREQEHAREGKGDAGSRTVIIALTGHAMKGDRERCIEAGMDDYLPKPIIVEQLREVMERCLPKKASTGQNVPASGAPVGEHDARSTSIDVKQTILPIIDKQVIDNIRSLQIPGKPDLLNKLIDYYFGEADRLLEAMRRGVASDDASALRQAAHSLKSCSANLGALSLAELCRQMEALCRDNSLDNASMRVKQIETTYSAVHDALAEIRGWRRDE